MIARKLPLPVAPITTFILQFQTLARSTVSYSKTLFDFVTPASHCGVTIYDYYARARKNEHHVIVIIIITSIQPARAHTQAVRCTSVTITQTP